VTDSLFDSNLQMDRDGVPSYNRSLLYAVALALSLAVLAISAALAWDQMNLVIDNVQRRNYVEQLDALKNNQRKLVYGLDQTARLHSRLLVEQHHPDACDTDVVFPGELTASPVAGIENPYAEQLITTSLIDTGCTSRYRLLRRLSRSLAISVHNFWNYPEISSYTFDLDRSFLAQSSRFSEAPAMPGRSVREQIAIATAALQPGIRQLHKAVRTPALPFFTGLHRRTSGTDDVSNVLSIGVPIYGKGKLFAISAIDIAHRAFGRVFLQGGRLPGFFVFDTSHASPILLNDITADERPLSQSIAKHWVAINTVAHDMTVTRIGHRFYLAETIAGTPWVAIYSFSFGDIFLVSESLWMWVGFSMFGALLLLWSGIYLINRCMLVPLDLAAQRIAASENLNRTIIATAPVGLCMLDLQTMKVLLTNDLARSYAACWGRRPGLAHCILEAYAAIADPSAIRAGRTVLYTELPAPEAIDAPPLLAAFSQVRHHERDILLCGLSDITQRKQAEAMLLQARQNADDANVAKSMFLATISHEIRTPLHGAMGNLELLENTPLSPSQHSTIDTINRAFFSLLQIINNVLDLSKAGASQLHLSSDVFDPVSLFEDVARTFAPCIAKKQVDFFLLLDRRLPQRMIGDEARLRQIFNNLLSNAIKFTGKGKIVMRVDLPTSSSESPSGHAQTGYCSFVVQMIDSGIGISECDQQKLFMPFQQANNTIAGTFGGTGLGLSLVRNLCEAMGGTIGVDSREHQGANFTVSLKLPIPDAADVANTANTADAANDSHATLPMLTGAVIALCCDDGLWRSHLREQLEAAGAIVHTAGTHASASTSEPAIQTPCDICLIACQDHQTSGYLPRLAEYPQARHVIMTPLGPLPPEPQDGCIRVSALSQRGLLLALDPKSTFSQTRDHLSAEPTPKPENAANRVATSTIADVAASPIAALPAATTAAASINILLVEDDLVNVTLAQQQLALLGYHRIDLACNGVDALKKCEGQHYQLVLTDQFMPEMDGNLLAATLRKKAYPARIIMMTASRPGPADRQNLDAVLLKPVSIEQLGSVLNSHCSQPSQITATGTAAAATTSGQAMLWNAFLQDYASTMDALEMAADAGERAKCLQQLHKLKGALGILRQPLAKRVATLEKHSKTAPLTRMGKDYRALRQALDRLIAARAQQ
jgi:two-component system capsular synthesis sensor histidine kinase RcsC